MATTDLNEKVVLITGFPHFQTDESTILIQICVPFRSKHRNRF